MNEALIRAVVLGCVSLLKSIESIQADEQLSGNDVGGEIQADLIGAYNSMTDQLSLVLGQDAKKLVCDLIASEIEAMRAVLRASKEGV